MEDKKYYHKINNLDISLEETNRKYIMIHQWAKDFSHKWGIASFEYEEDEGYWYLRTYGNFNSNIDWYDFGCLVDLGYKWIKELRLGGLNGRNKKIYIVFNKMASLNAHFSISIISTKH